MNVHEIRAMWLKEPPSQLRTTGLQMCDEYEKAMRSIVLNEKQAKQALEGKPITGKVVTYGEIANGH